MENKNLSYSYQLLSPRWIVRSPVVPEAGIEKNGGNQDVKPSVQIIEYSNKPEKAVVPTTSVL